MGVLKIKNGSTWEEIGFGEDASKVSKSGDTMTGSLQLKSSNVEGDVVPNSAQYGDAELALYDKNGVRFGYFIPFNENGKQGTIFSTTRNVGGSDIYHGLKLGIDANGNKTVSFDHLDAWLSALYLIPTDLSSSVSTNGNYGTYSDTRLYKFGRIAIFSMIARMTGTGTTKHIASVPSSCTPITQFWLSCDKYGSAGKTNECQIVNDNGEGRIKLSNTETGDMKIFGVWITAS